MEQDVKNIRIEEYSYTLPDERIAKYPVSPRDTSKLLIYEEGNIREDQYRHLRKYLPKDAFLLFNQTRVVQARLIFPKNEATNIEVFCLEPEGNMDIQHAMQASSPLRYKCLVGGARKWKSGKLSISIDENTSLYAEKIDRDNGTFVIEFSWDGDSHFADILEKAGKTPLPPYLNREAEEADKSTYQTLFARENGSVAAPTAGLHFTESLLQELKDFGIDKAFITLHVGAGTFKPVATETMAEHDMHYEEFFIDKNLVNALLDNLHRPIIPVGTTSLRALESIYWLGVKILKTGIPENDYIITQWEPYNGDSLPSPREALQAVAYELSVKNLDIITAKTQLIIAPGYEHQICSGLLTNFHQPKSTLLLLVSSFVGPRWRDIYNYALSHDFRFLSYGDGCLILKPRS